MFGFLRPRLAPDGPVELRCDAVIERSAEEVYALIDWADPRNGKRELGAEITRVEGAPGRYRMIMGELPDHLIEISVTEDVPHASYAFTCEAVPIIGRLMRSHELYSFLPLTAASCQLTLVVTATFINSMRLKDFENEVATMALACRNALAKLKIHAEEGVEAVRAIQGQLVA